ncbi:MAG: hypothetical protein IJ532_01710 [Alphaproteobacteria bacterium]|nr:hypothetical protein [Alphaproteobacteria bacterium]
MVKDLKKQLRTDTKKAKIRVQETFVAIKYYSKIVWGAVKKPLMSFSMAAVLASCGFTKTQTRNAEQDAKQDQIAQVVSTNEEPSYGYSNPNEVVETPEEKSAREAEEEYWKIMEGRQTHGDAGTDKTDYGKPGKGAPQMTAEDYEKIREAYSQIGTGMDNIEQAELEREIMDRATSGGRTASWAKAVRDAGRGK